MKKTLLIIILISNVFAANYSTAKNIDEQLDDIDNSIVIDRITNNDIEVQLPSVIFTFTETPVKIKFNNPQHTRLLINENKIHFIINGDDKELVFVDGIASFNQSFSDNNSLNIYTEEFSYSNKITAYPMWVFIVPVLLIIGWLIFRKKNKGKK